MAYVYTDKLIEDVVADILAPEPLEEEHGDTVLAVLASFKDVPRVKAAPDEIIVVVAHSAEGGHPGLIRFAVSMSAMRTAREKVLAAEAKPDPTNLLDLERWAEMALIEDLDWSAPRADTIELILQNLPFVERVVTSKEYLESVEGKKEVPIIIWLGHQHFEYGGCYIGKLGTV